LGWVKLSLVVQIGGEKSQIFIVILLIVFGLQLIVNPVLYTKHKYIYLVFVRHVPIMK